MITPSLYVLWTLRRTLTLDRTAPCCAASLQVPLLYWRRDVLASYGLTSAPATWDDLLAVATAINGTDLDGDGQGDPALCWHTQGCYDAGTVLAAILAPLTQQQVGDAGSMLPADRECTAMYSFSALCWRPSWRRSQSSRWRAFFNHSIGVNYRTSGIIPCWQPHWPSHRQRRGRCTTMDGTRGPRLMPSEQ